MMNAPKMLGQLFIVWAVCTPFVATQIVDAAQDTPDEKQKEPASGPKHAGKLEAPHFPQGIEWLNTDRPFSWADLRGKVVVLDFWTYCCINCMHVLPELKKLEREYPNELFVIGVHSAKFTNEKDTENIRQAILRYEIEHPVINDRDMVVWRHFAVRAWPTLYIVDPLGKVLGYMSGEAMFEPLDKLVGEIVEEFDKYGLMNREPILFELERDRQAEPILLFPGKVLADEATARLFISDSNHNRIIVTSLDGAIHEVIGNGEVGLKDGSFNQAMFNHPQGLALNGQNLYVADTENHAIRRIDLERRVVSTLAGMGQQARQFNVSGTGTDVALNSPWALVWHDGVLYIAMAGSHQLWKLNLETNHVSPYAGTGREARIDGPLAESALAQPSGLTTDGTKLYFADSEISAIRSADLDPSGRVETIVGLDLFEFGDRDGVGPQVRLQHPLGVVFHDGLLYVADTYNNKIKRIDLATKHTSTFLGTGQQGLQDGDSPSFDEPAGLTTADGRLFIADTNNHVIRVADLKTKEVSTLELKGLEKLQPARPAETFAGERIALPPEQVAPGKGTFTLDIELPKGFKLNPGAPSRVVLSSPGDAVVFDNNESTKTVSQPEFPLTLPLKLTEGKGLLIATMILYYCQSTNAGLCYVKEVQVELPIDVFSSGKTCKVKFTYSLITEP